MARAYVALGSNVGDGPAVFEQAAEAIRGLGDTVGASGLYRSPAFGTQAPEPDYWNAVLVVETALEPEAFLAGLLAVEAALGRKRPVAGGPAPGPRPVDLDLLLYGRECRDLHALRLPHPRLLGRGFVVRPLLEADPAVTLPDGRSISDAGVVSEPERKAGADWAAIGSSHRTVPASHVDDDLLAAGSLTGAPIYLYGRVGSTTDVLRQLAAMGAPDGTAVAAEEQTAGRGRHGRRWEAARGSALLTSVLLRSGRSAGSLLPLVVGVAAVDAVTSSGGPAVRLKWPNDLLWQGRKAGGILVEGTAAGWALVGVGLNVRRLARNRLSSTQEHVAFLVTRGQFPRSRLLGALRDGLLVEMERLAKDGPAALLKRWVDRSDTLGQVVTVHPPDGHVWSGQAVQLGEDGALWVKSEAGDVRPVHAGEVSVRLESQHDLPVWARPSV